MEFALVDGLRTPPVRGGRGVCPVCEEPVLAKATGSRLVTPHWAHVAGGECDPWAEPETAWHRGWKARFPAEWREVVIGPHRADVRTPDGTVIEFQHSFLADHEIAERERFYKDMRWVIDARRFDIGHRRRVCVGSSSYGRGASEQVFARYEVEFTPLRETVLAPGDTVKFRWRHPHRSWEFARCPILLDLGLATVWVQKFYWNRVVGGWGFVGGPGIF